MPAYSFKERFIPFIQDGSKGHTIRNKRKGQAKPGSTLYLYFGMRTKWCKKIAEKPCVDVKECVITSRNTKNRKVEVYLDSKRLPDEMKDLFAFNDGFRHSDDPNRVDGCFELLTRWWQQTHSLPFCGDIIIWNKNLPY